MENKIKKLLIGFFVMMIVFTIISRAAASAMVAKVQVDSIKSGNLTFEVDGTGIVKADAHKYIDLMNGLKIGKVSAQEGQHVEKGDFLFAYDLETLKLKESDLKDDLDKLKLQYQNIGLTGNTATDTNEDYAKATVNAAKDDLNSNKSELEEQKKVVRDNKEKAYKEAVANWEDINSSMKKAETEADRTVADATNDLAKLKKTETKAEALINDYKAAIINKDKVDEAYNSIFNFYYDNKYKEHQKLVLNAQKALKRAKEDQAETVDKWNNTVIEYDPLGGASESNAYREQLQAKNDDLKNAQRAVTDAQDNLDDLTKNDVILGAAIQNYRKDVLTNSTNIVDSYKALYQFLTDGKTAKEEEINEAETKLARAQQDQQEVKLDWVNKLKDAADKRDSIESDLKEIEAGSYDYTQDLKDINMSLKEAEKNLNSAKQQLEQTEEENRTTKENQEIQRDIQKIDINKTQKELDQLNKIILDKGKIYAPVAGDISVNDLVQGMTLSGQEKFVITIGGYELSMTADKEVMKYFAAGDELEIKAENDDQIQSTIEYIGLADQDGMVTFSALLPEGEYKIGSSLDYDLKKDSKQYSLCIPIQALRQDTNGTFILLAKEKDSVLGKIEEAFRVDVTLVAKDSKTAAVDASLVPDDKIIIGSNKNFSEGDRVRTYEVE